MPRGGRGRRTPAPVPLRIHHLDRGQLLPVPVPPALGLSAGRSATREALPPPSSGGSWGREGGRRPARCPTCLAGSPRRQQARARRHPPRLRAHPGRGLCQSRHRLRPGKGDIKAGPNVNLSRQFCRWAGGGHSAMVGRRGEGGWDERRGSSAVSDLHSLTKGRPGPRAQPRLPAGR